jgi:Tol biopolymer transport system component
MRFLSAAGYARPSWSPDGRWIAAEKTDGKGRDVVILNASSGAEVARLTNDGGSFAPTWSPDGTAVAFLHAQGTGIDLDLAVLGPGSPFATSQIIALTESSLLDGTSRPAWFIPALELPTPVPTAPPASAPASNGPSPGGP